MSGLATLSSSSSSSNGTNQLSVDPSTGTYTTLLTAKAAATTGQTITVKPGTFGESAITPDGSGITQTTLAKTGVAYDFAPNATLSYAGTAFALFADCKYTNTSAAVSSISAITARIVGAGILTRGTITPSGNHSSSIIFQSSPSSNLYIEAEEISDTMGASADIVGTPCSPCLICAGTFVARVRRFSSTNNNGFWWASGNCSITATEGIFAQNKGMAVYAAPILNVSGSPGVTELWITGTPLIKSERAPAILMATYGNSETKTVWSMGAEIISKSTAVANLAGNNSKVYIDTPKIGIVGKTTTDIINNVEDPDTGTQYAVTVHWGAGQNWLSANKVACGDYGFWLDGASCKSWNEYTHLEDVETASGFIHCVAGTHYIKNGQAIGGAAIVYGVSLVGGTLVVEGGSINTSASAAGIPVGVDATGLTLKNVTITAHAAVDGIASISGDPQNVAIEGIVSVNTSVDANITFTGGGRLIVNGVKVYGA